MNKDQIKALLLKYDSGTCTDEEKALLETWFLREHSEDLPKSSEIEQDLHLVWAELNKDYQQHSRIINWPRIAAAASIILALSTSGYFLFHKKSSAPQITKNQQNDIAPGGNKAVLTLSNGKKISLTDAKSGILAKQGKTAVNKTADGEVVYKAGQTSSTVETTFNIINTPRGGKWTVTLPDNSKVWLDASSSIRFPTSFSGNDRTVEITGQVYFEVAHNASKPFRVSVMGQTIQDIGTHFNINAYNDEPVIKTTLIEGGISLTKGKEKTFLKPGQQALTQSNTNTIQVRDIDTEEAIAWKNGYFLFDNESLESVMRKISRWYDVDIAYSKGQEVTENYWGSITQYDKVSKVLKMLEVTGNVRFKVDGKTIIVLKK